MLESEIKKLTVAVEANTAALTGGAAPVAAAAPAAAAATAIEIPVDIPPVETQLGTGAEVVVPPADLKQITEGIVALCKAKGRDAAALLMAEYGAQKVPDLKKVSDKYPEILAKINALIAA